MEKKPYYSPKEIAELFGVNNRCVYRWIKEGKLAAAKIGQWRISYDNLNAFCAAQGYVAAQISPDEAKLLDLIREKGPDKISKLMDELEAE